MTYQPLQSEDVSLKTGEAFGPGVTLSGEDAHFLAVRLRRLCAHHGYALPKFADDDAHLINIAGSVIGALLTNAAAGVKEPLPAETAQPMFASAVGRRKWEQLQGDGYRMQRISFARSIDGHERRGTIDPWGKVLWEPAGVNGTLEADPALSSKPAQPSKSDGVGASDGNTFPRHPPMEGNKK